MRARTIIRKSKKGKGLERISQLMMIFDAVVLVNWIVDFCLLQIAHIFVFY